MANGGRALVTGGAGFIGSNLVGSLVDGGFAVSVLDDLSSGFASNLEPFPGVSFVRGDVRDRKAVREAMEGAEYVFHLAASVGNKRSIDHPLLDAEINVLGTLNVLEEARTVGAKKVVFSSSAGIFGELMTLPIKEDHRCEPDSPYGATKLCAEKQCLAYTKLYGLETVCLRYFNVYGRNQRFDAYGNVIPIFVFKMLAGEGITVFGDGEQTRDFVEVRDVVQANIKAATTPGAWGAFNIASATRITINDLIAMIGEATGIEPDVTYGPPREGDVLHSLADVSAATKAFGFCPSVEMREGLAEYCAWAKTEAVTA